ncbi:LuxR C-terminal-related transcriptional regulator [Sphingomonas sp. dw_22]|uniref:helix-turn-helix transcriptional regulator n=1 Tax=Sphingomonas sp. dw_22 TaxID=2721175 RepID=UPI001BD4DC9C|nr:LuxR C-terminal-related transcriptional regulator [Sphingomonas sp. dw_22]
MTTDDLILNIAQLPSTLTGGLHAQEAMRRGIANIVVSSATSVLWSGSQHRPDTPRKAANWSAMLAEHGITEGVSVAVRVPGRRRTTISFFTDRAEPDFSGIGIATEILGPRIVEAARSLRAMPSAPRTSNRVTDRQRQCLTLIAQGMSDCEAGKILGLSDQTVHAHIETLRRRYGVRRRSQLIVCALYDGAISFEDILGTPAAAQKWSREESAVYNWEE